jgi:hypothetical protein
MRTRRRIPGSHDEPPTGILLSMRPSLGRTVRSGLRVLVALLRAAGHALVLWGEAVSGLPPGARHADVPSGPVSPAEETPEAQARRGIVEIESYLRRHDCSH